MSATGHQTSAIWILALASLATAPGQTPLAGRFPGPLEKYDMPPVYIYRLDKSPRMISHYGSYVSYQVNVDANGNNIVARQARECMNLHYRLFFSTAEPNASASES